MNRERIESIYATFRHDSTVSGTQMALLQALAFCANPKNEACFPGMLRLVELTHFGASAIKEAKKALRAKGIITWSSDKTEAGDNDSCDYKFLFPHKKFESRRNKYESVGLEPTEGGAPADLGSVVKQPTVGREATTNIKNNNINLSVKEQGRGVGEPKPMFEVSSVLKKADYRTLVQRERDELITDALKACNLDPKDKDERAAFGSIISQIEASVVQDVIDQFRSEVAQGEHKKAKNLAAVLMTKLKLRIPLTDSVRRNNIESLITNRYS